MLQGKVSYLVIGNKHSVNASLRDNDFLKKEVNAKDWIIFQNEVN